MSGTITVNANGTTTTTTGSPPPITGPLPGYETPGGGQPGSATPQNGAGPGSPLAGSASSAVKVASTQRGERVRGTVEVSQAGAGARLEVDLFAKKMLLASAGAQASAGRLVLSGVHAGKVSFTVSLNGRARKALRRHHRLVLTVRIKIQAPGASALTLNRSVTLRP
jgi:hypothetical protein